MMLLLSHVYHCCEVHESIQNSQQGAVEILHSHLMVERVSDRQQEIRFRDVKLIPQPE